MESITRLRYISYISRASSSECAYIKALLCDTHGLVCVTRGVPYLTSCAAEMRPAVLAVNYSDVMLVPYFS